MLKDKEVISDPQSQYEIARNIHLQNHGGINKTTAVIATKYHWVRIKETVGQVIKNCPDCKDSVKTPVRRETSRDRVSKTKRSGNRPSIPVPDAMVSDGPFSTTQSSLLADHSLLAKRELFPAQSQQPMHGPVSNMEDYSGMSIDPQIMAQLTAQLDPPFQHPASAYTQPGLSHFTRPPQMHHHHHPQHDEYATEDGDQFMSDPNPGGIEHDQSMDLVEGSQLNPEAQLHQQLLQNTYVDSDGNPHYKQ